ncbi:discoidin domain-containing protein [Niabella sp. CC-SYL272]|uniref:discoidin domain-containing protein n=1 Tax=Niabella agricola TaxID=2891571 RepID=UPI001F2334A4|nr:discoidin domain-containing protein [Niabella agricola]MCF3107328.1 discoidin domain-containing protein [Niabella agricola]
MINGTTTGSAFFAVELEAWSAATDRALHIVPTTNASVVQGSLQNLTDGLYQDEGSWVVIQPPSGPPVYFIVDLGAVFTDIDEIKVWLYQHTAPIVWKNVKTEVSTDNANWTVVSEAVDVPGSKTVPLIAPVPDVILSGDYVIKNKSGGTVAIVSPTGTQTREAMGTNVVDMEFTLHSPVEFKKGDWCTVYGEKYFVNILPTVKKDTSSTRYQYTMQLEHESYLLKNRIFSAPDSANALKVKQFSMTGNLGAFLNLVVQNANVLSSGWTSGVAEVSEAKTLQFNGEDILQVLTRLADEFGTEYWIENKTIHLAKRQGSSGITLEYGKGKGLLSLTKNNKDNTSVYTRLYAEGGTRNVRSDYGHQRIQLPSGTGGYVEDAGKIAQYGIIEKYEAFEDIYPMRVGTISAVDTDPTIFFDAALDFDINAQAAPGIDVKIAFQTGALAGLEFTINSYDHATRKIKINTNDDNGIALPNTTLKPAVGDKYIVLDIIMPLSYETDAENRLLAAATDRYGKISDEEYNGRFLGDCDRIHFKKNSLELTLGYTVNIKSVPLGVDTDKRVSVIKRDLRDPWKYPEVEFTDKIELSAISKGYAASQRVNNVLAIVAGTGGGAGGGSSDFLSQLSGAAGYLYISNVKAKAGFADVAQEAIHAYTADTAAASDLARSVQSLDYSPGFTGAGHKLEGGTLEVDYVKVRKALEAYTLLIREITGAGGSVAITDVGKILSVTGSGPYVCEFDTDGGTIFNPFQLNDIVRCQVWDSSKAKYYQAVVSAVTGSSFTLSIIEGAGVPEAGDKLFHFGNTSNTARQSLIYLTNSDTGAPYMKFLDGINSTNLAGKEIIHIGKLDGLTSPVWGPLSGSGGWMKNLYLENAHISGSINVTGGNAATKGYVDGIIDGSPGIRYIRDWCLNGSSAHWVEIKALLADNGNVALGKPAVPSMPASTSPGHSPFTVVTDGLVDSNHSAILTSSPQNCQVDLGAIYDVKSVIVWHYWIDGRVYTNTKTEVSADGINWVTIFDSAVSGTYNESSTGHVMTVPPVIGTGIRGQIETANAAIALLSNDNKLTPDEKQQLKIPYGKIVNEVEDRKTLAASLGVSSVDYNAKWLVLQGYVGPLLTDLSTTSDVDGTLMRQYFSDYYIQLSLLDKAIQAKQKQNTDTAQSAASAAQAVANQAGLDVAAANAAIADMANDNKLTPDEKQVLKQEYDKITSEKTAISSQANAVGLSSSDQAPYNNSFNTLTGYINSNGLLTDLTTTSTVNGATLRSYFTNYNAEKYWILNSISVKLRDTAAAADTKATNANSAIVDLANDDKLTPVEKQKLKQDYDAIVAEFQPLTSQANNLGVSYSTYQTAYNNFTSYVTSNNLLTDLTTTSPVSGSTLANRMVTYNTEKYWLMSSIAAKQKDNTSGVATGLNNSLNSLLDMNPGEAIDWAKLGNTTTIGGYIKTVLLDVIWLKAQIITATNIEAVNATLKRIRTATTGRRVEILDTTNNVSIYDESNNKALEMAYNAAISDYYFYIDINANITADKFQGTNRTQNWSQYNSGSYDSRTGAEADFTNGFPRGYDWRKRQFVSGSTYRYWFRFMTHGFRVGDPDGDIEVAMGGDLPNTTAYDKGIITGNLTVMGKMKTSILDHRGASYNIGFGHVNVIWGNFTLPMASSGGLYTAARLNQVYEGTQVVLCNKSGSAVTINTDPSGSWIENRTGTLVSSFTLNSGQTGWFQFLRRAQDGILCWSVIMVN